MQVCNEFKNFPTEFVPKYAYGIASFSLVFPIAMEALIGIKEIYTHCDSLFLFIKKFSSNPIGEETKKEAKERQRSHIKIVLLGTLILGGVGASAFYVLTPIMALSLTIFAASLLARTYNDPYWIAKKLLALKECVIDACLRRPLETSSHFAYRLAKNFCITIVALFGLTVLAMAFQYLVAGTLVLQFPSGWIALNPEFLAKISSPFFVYAGHFLIGISGICKAMTAFEKGKFLEACLSFLTAPLAFVAPFQFAAMGELRWHHLSYGLLLMLSPFRSLQFFGSLMAFDGALYFINPLRGYDFSDLFVSHLKDFLSMFALSSSMELANSSLKEYVPVL